MGNLSRKRRFIVVGISVLAVGAAALAYAAWTASGTGSGFAKAGTATALTTSDVSATTTASLYPGVNGDVKIQINNPNPYPVRVTDITGNGAATVKTAGLGTCTTTGVTFNDQHSLTIDIAAKSGGVDGTTTTTLTGAAHMSNASDNGCQSAVFELPVSLSGVSNAS
jgi:hypothetical protein